MLGVLMLAAGISVAGVYEDMLHAVNNDDEQAVSQLLKRGVDVNTVDANGDSLLALAARRGKPEMMKTLLDARPRINTRNAHGETALMLAAFNGHTGAVQALLAQGAEFNHPGWNSLIYAATRNRLDIARILIGRGAQVNAEAENGTTALMMAAREGHLQMVLLLLEHGADINHKTHAGSSALSMAKSQDRREIVQTLVRAGAVE
jgi:ankyrin repeat protein